MVDFFLACANRGTSAAEKLEKCLIANVLTV